MAIGSRLRTVGKTGSIQQALATEGDFTISNFASVLENSFGAGSRNSLRVPFYLTSSLREENGQKGVSMMMNPTTISFSQPKRTTRVDTQAGTAFFHWSDRNGRNNDILNMSFSGQTGNISIKTGTVQRGISQLIKEEYTSTSRDREGPIQRLNKLSQKNTDNQQKEFLSVKNKGSDYARSGASKISNFFNLYSLTREPLIHDGKPVEYYITYSSPLFGNTFVTFTGHFDQVLEFSESADNPLSVQYSFGFTVLSSTPSMDEIYSVVTTNLGNLFTNPVEDLSNDAGI